MYNELFKTLCRKLNINSPHSNTNCKDNIKDLNSFRQIENYPLFINFRKILFLIDGTLNTQFFQRQIQNKISKIDERCDIEFIENCNYRLNNYIIPNALNFELKTYFLRPPILKTDNSITKQEINEDDFSQIFFQTVLNKNLIKLTKNLKLSSSLIFSQIHSIIKGSIFSHLSYMNCISREEYSNVTNKLTELTQKQKEVVYDIFKEYEKWKLNNNYFDLQDFVNHIIRQVKIELQFKNDNIKLIDYLYIDEVQDLTMNQIYLLTLITGYPLVYAGDTCQTVSKSIRFRFTDLFQIFHTFSEIIDNYQKPIHAPLNKNFRFGPNILKMSNFFSDLIYEIFPNSIDKFTAEFTLNDKNYLPSTLNQIDSLIKLMSINPEKNFSFFKFAAFHCVICRSSEIAENLQKKYEKLLITDITYSKGLEFEIVIIYNFFNDSKCKKFWLEVLKSIDIIEKRNEKLENMKKTMKCDKLDENAINKVLKTFEYIYCPKLNKEIDNNLYYEFCTELKQLYVAITRARTFLIFYDEDSEVYPLFLKKLEGINLIYREEEQIVLNKISAYLDDSDFKINKQALENDGDKYFEMKKYNIAEYYYKMVNKDKTKKSKAYQIFSKISEIKRDKKDNYVKLNEEVIYILKEINCLDEIYGECLLNLNRYEEALNFFEEKGNLIKCGKICLEFIKDFGKAFVYYDVAKEYSLALDALFKGKKYEKLFSYVNENNNILDLYLIADIYKKYSFHYLKSFFIKLKTFKQKTINNFITLERRVDPKSLKFLYFDSFSKIQENLKFENNFLKIISKEKKTILELEQILKYKYDDGHNLQFFNKINYDLFKIKNNNSYIYRRSSPSCFILLDFEKNNDYDLTKDFVTNKNNKEKFMKLFNFIQQYISIVQEKSKSMKIKSSNILIEDFDKFLDLKFYKTICENVENIKLYPDQCKTILKSISTFGNSENLKTLYSVFITSNLPSINREIYSKTQINFWKRNEPDSSEYYFMINKKFIKEDFHNFITKNKENLRELSKETLIEILKIIKQLNITEDESAKLLTKLLFMNGYYESLITLVNFPFNLYLSCVTSNYKLFHRLINQVNLNTNFNVDAYVLTNHIRLNLCKIFTYLDKWRQVNPEKQILIRIKMDFCISNLFNYGKIYELIYHIFKSFDLFVKQANILTKTPPIIFYMREFRKFLENPENYINSKQQILDLIEIGSTLSFFFFVYGGDYFKFLEISEFDNREEKSEFICEIFEEIKYFMIALTTFSTDYFTFQNGFSNNNYYIRLIFFSFFNIFNVTTFPNEKLFNNVFGNLTILIINTNSIIFTEETFKTVANKIFKSKKTKNFDSKGENFIIKYNSIYYAFFKLISNFCTRLFDFSYKSITLIKDPWFEEYPHSRLNEVIKCYSIFFNYYFIQGFSSYNSNNFIKEFPSYFKFIIENKLSSIYFKPNSFKIYLENFTSNEKEIFSKTLNVNLMINLSSMSLVNANNYLNKRSVLFLDSFIKTLFNSRNTLLHETKENLIHFYFLNFLVCGNNQNLLKTIKTDSISEIEFKLFNLNILLNKRDYLKFCFNSIEFIEKFKEHFSALMLLIWIKKLSLFIYLLIHFFIHPDYDYFKFNIFCSNLPNEDVIFISELHKQLNKKYKDEQTHENSELILLSTIEDEMKKCLLSYFSILKYFLHEYMNIEDEEIEENNIFSTKYLKEFPKYIFSPVLKQFFELEIYKIYLTLNNNIINMYLIKKNEKFDFLNLYIKEFSDNYLDVCQFKENYKNKQKVDFNKEFIKFDFVYNNINDIENLKGYIKKKEIEINSNETVANPNSLNKFEDKLILKYFKNENFVFKLSPILNTQEKINSYNFIYSNKLDLEQYIKLIDEIYINLD